MHEIRATLRQEQVAEALRLASRVGISRVTVADVFVYGTDAPRKLISVETSTPKARAFADALLSSPAISEIESVTSRELRAVIDGTDFDELTQPMREPVPNIIQDLWQLSHITVSYLSRALAGGILLAIGISENDPIAIVVAALFLPFLAELLAMSLGCWVRDWRLVLRGLEAMLVSTILAFVGGMIVGSLTNHPVLFNGFRPLLPSIATSAIIGITAGISIGDDTGRRYLIGVAAAVQLAVFPTWLGVTVISGLPAREILTARVATFVLNLITIAVTSLASYSLLRVTSIFDVGQREA